MSGKLDDLYVDLSLRNYGAVMGGLGAVRSSIAGLKSFLGSGLALNLAGIGGAGAFAKISADLEAARLGLKRFVDADFGSLARGIDTMSTRIPIAIEGLYDIASGAAQVGVEGTANILKFTEVTGKLATVSSLSFNETSKELAKLLNVMQLAPDKAGKVANIIAGLSAASAADPGELITMMKQIGGTGSVIGMRIEDVGALSAAIKDAGANSEVAGTAINKMFGDMIKKAAEFAQLLGISESEFKKLRNADPFGAARRTLGAIDRQPTLEDKLAAQELIGIESTRQGNIINMMLRVIGKVDSHRELAGRLGGDASEGELNKQFGTQAAGTWKQLQLLGNELKLTADQGFSPFLDAVKGASSALREFMGFLRKPLVSGNPADRNMGGSIGAIVDFFGGKNISDDLNKVVREELEAAQLRKQARRDAELKGLATPEERNAARRRFDQEDERERLRAAARGVILPTPGEQKQTAEDSKLEAERKELRASLDHFDSQLSIAGEEWRIYKEALEAAAKKLEETTDAANAAILRDMKENTPASRKDMLAKNKARLDAFSARDKSLDDFTAADRRFTQEKGKYENAKSKLDAMPKSQEAEEKHKTEARLHGIQIEEGGRKYAFDALMDPQAFRAFENAFKMLPQQFRDSDAGKLIASKLDARKGTELAKNMTEDQVSQLAQKRASAMQSITDAAARERAQRLWARPVFENADTMWKRIAAGGAEGPPLERMLKEQTRLQKEQTAEIKKLNDMFAKGLVEFKNGAIIMTGSP